MIFGIGIDIIEVERIAKALNSTPGFKSRIFSSNEIAYSEPKPFPAMHFAARFAAKEAFFKALGTGHRYGMRFNEVEVNHDELGKPFIKLYGKTAELYQQKNLGEIHISLSHTRGYACAVVIIEKP